MLQVNHYRKICYLTDSEVDRISEFFKTMFEVDKITEIKVYIDEKSDIVCDIIGFQESTSNVVGSIIKHDREV